MFFSVRFERFRSFDWRAVGGDDEVKGSFEVGVHVMPPVQNLFALTCSLRAIDPPSVLS